MNTIFSWPRFVAVLLKEFVQMKRDRLTFGMIVGIPIIQLILFGFAINTDPKGLPAALVSADESPFARTLVRSLENSQYFRFTHRPASEREGDRLLQLGDVQFVLVIPADFSRKLQRGEHPQLLVAADATDPSATGNAINALNLALQQSMARELTGPLAVLKQGESPVDLRIQRRYNPEGITRYNIVPGLMGIILTMTMIMMTSLAMTRERERGTMENLLATPVRPFEVMAGKIAPFIIVGYLQVALILTAAKLLFGVPVVGSLWLLSASLVVFIAANLSVGFTFSTIAKNQLQAMQMTFLLLPAVDVAVGFHVPVSRHAGWAQTLGEACRSRISCASCAASCSRATVSARSSRSCGRSRSLCCLPVRSR